MSEVNLLITIVWMMAYRLRKLLPKATCWKVAESDFCTLLEPLLAVPKQLFNHLGVISQIMDQMEIKIFAGKKKCSVFCYYVQCSDQISHSVVSDSLRPHESKHARPPCP